MQECGQCSLCCFIVPVSILDKSAYQECKNCSGNGCDIHPERPDACRNYFCRWAVEGWSENLRPDRCHVVFETIPNCITYVALIDPRTLENPDEMNRTWPAVEEKIRELVRIGHPVVAGTSTLRKVFAINGLPEQIILNDLLVSYRNYLKI